LTTPRYITPAIAVLLSALALMVPALAHAQTGTATGGVSPTDPAFQPAGKAKLVNGIAIPPVDAPPEVVSAINAANEIVTKPYRYGGGHRRGFIDSGYDCSGSVSYALHGAGLLDSPLDSSSFMRWGEAGRGKWMTIYTNPGHAFLMIAGLRFDTGYRSRLSRQLGAKPGTGPRWDVKRSTRGFRARHPLGL
jgi:cell wall-associated NlpC family hydrolase